MPTFQDIMRPLLEYLAREGGSAELSHLREGLINDFPEMTEEEFAIHLSSGERLFFNRTRWAINELKRAGFIISPERAHYAITKSGRDAAADKRARIDRRYLKEYSKEYSEWFQESTRRAKRSGQPRETDEPTSNAGQGDYDATPDEEVDAAIHEIHTILKVDILERTRRVSDKRFEQLAVDLLLAMGYGDSGERVGGRGDGGIDGIVYQDRLGFEKIYIQAKRYGESNNVSPNLVRDFSGALDTKGMRKGVFITTSSFSDEAREAAESMQKQIILIDGKELANLMVQYNVGCSEKPLVLKAMEENFFRE